MFKNLIVRIWLVLLMGHALLKNTAIAQDPVYTQTYLAPIYMNPAATGTGEHDLRISGIVRRQWWTIPTHMNYMAASVDKYVGKINTGFGVLATRSSEGYLNKTGFHGTVAHHFELGSIDIAGNEEAPRLFFMLGLQAGFAKTSIDYSKLYFADQLNTGGVFTNSTGADMAVNNGRFYHDFAAGAYANYNISQNWRVLAGYSCHHINKIDESLTNTSDTFRSQLPKRKTISLLFTHSYETIPWTVSFGGTYYKQGLHSIFQTGFMVTENEIDMSFGLWYRGTTNKLDMQTLGITVIYNFSGRANERNVVKTGVAHDIQMGNNTYSYTAGSSEMGFVWDVKTYDYENDNPSKPRISPYLCPTNVRQW